MHHAEEESSMSIPSCPYISHRKRCSSAAITGVAILALAAGASAFIPRAAPSSSKVAYGGVASRSSSISSCKVRLIVMQRSIIMNTL